MRHIMLLKDFAFSHFRRSDRADAASCLDFFHPHPSSCFLMLPSPPPLVASASSASSTPKGLGEAKRKPIWVNTLLLQLFWTRSMHANEAPDLICYYSRSTFIWEGGCCRLRCCCCCCCCCMLSLSSALTAHCANVRTTACFVKEC